MPMMEMPLPPMMVAQVVIERPVVGEGNRGLSPDSMARITLELPWIVPNDRSLDLNTPGNFVAVFQKRACNALLKGYKFKPLKWTSATCKLIEIVTSPKHGMLVDDGGGVFRYKPSASYLGMDSVHYLVEGDDGRRVLVTLPIKVTTIDEALSVNDFEIKSVVTYARNRY